MTTGPAMATTPGGTAGLAAMAASTTVAPATRTPAVASAAGSLSAMAASATFSGSAAATSSATSATSTPTPSTLAATVGVRGRGMQRLVIKQNQWRRGERRTSEKCNGDLTDKTNWQHVA